MPNKIFLEVLDPKQKKLLPLLKSFSRQFYLAGGTALALQLGHRRSIDFDLFCSKEFDNAKISRILKQKKWQIEKVLRDERGEYTAIVNSVKITFLHYPFKIKTGRKFADLINLPDSLALAAMKAYALGRRAKWKDYADLYWVMRKFYPLDRIINKAKTIFDQEFNEKNFRRQLAYFTDVDYSEKIQWLKDFKVSDQEIKKSLIECSLK